MIKKKYTFAAKFKKIMGRGDKRTAKGKRTRASYGKSRPKPNKKATVKA
ncbi:MAG: 30S ribosomal protein THX [Saprospiraceae bacterium]